MTKLPLAKAIAFFVIGYAFGSVIVTVIARMHDDSWSSGPMMVGLSFPTAIIYFFALWALGKRRFLSPTSAGMALAGCLSAFYPAFCGFFPVYFMRLKFAAPIFAGQLLFLVVAMAISARLENTRR